MNEETLGKPPEIKVVPAEEGVFEDYGNQIDLGWTLFDVTIRIGHLVPTERSAGKVLTWVTEETSAITIPWAQAKALRDLLNIAVTRYEELNGEMKFQEMKLP